jgi:hypothetical protein
MPWAGYSQAFFFRKFLVFWELLLLDTVSDDTHGMRITSAGLTYILNDNDTFVMNRCGCKSLVLGTIPGLMVSVQLQGSTTGTKQLINSNKPQLPLLCFKK